MSVRIFGILPVVVVIIVVVCSMPTSCNSLCRGLKYRILFAIILSCLIFDFRSYFWTGRQYWFISQKWTAFIFGSTYLDQTFNKHILIYRNARCDCKLWKVPWFYSVFEYFHTLLKIIHVWIVISLQTFTDCVYSWCTHFDMSTCQMWL